MAAHFSAGTARAEVEGGAMGASGVALMVVRFGGMITAVSALGLVTSSFSTSFNLQDLGSRIDHFSFRHNSRDE